MGEDADPAGRVALAPPRDGEGDRDAKRLGGGGSPGTFHPADPLHHRASLGGPPPRPGEELVRAALSAAATRFGFSQTPRLDAELLMAHALGVSREALLLRHLDEPTPPGFAALTERRARHEPIAYITGRRAFWTIELAVAAGVLIPRADSETLIEAAVAHFGGRSPRTILDLGVGSGALLLAALAHWPNAIGLGVDTSNVAVRIARANAERLGLAARARITRGSWDGDGGAHDLILCNPPYVAESADLPREVRDHEPAAALFAGADGLDCHRRIAPLLRAQLAPGGVACIEIGADQGRSAVALFVAEGLTVDLRQDLAGRDRCLIVTP